MSELPDEPEIMDARRAYVDAQIALAGVPESRSTAYNTMGWYGTDFHSERGSFAVVNEDGPLLDLIGDRLRIRYGSKAVNVYCFGALPVEDGHDIVVPRRVFAAVELLAMDRIAVIIETMAGEE